MSRNQFFNISIPIGSILFDVKIDHFNCDFFYLSDTTSNTEIEKYYIMMDKHCNDIHCEPNDLKLITHINGYYLFEVLFPCVVENLKQMGDIRE